MDRRLGLRYAVLAYLSWGLVPIYWKLVSGIPPLQVTAHRILWALVFYLIFVHFKKQWSALWGAFNWSRSRWFAASALLILVNWFLYIWAVMNDRIVDASLGYFMNPIFNIFLGALFLRERLNSRQWASVVFCVLG
ncbi:MAG: EamA family transporter, partial [Bdellovibrionaceae bacterium]|nr:EamA family transporter [Pseudobdellovibrionaceae bacterium]